VYNSDNFVEKDEFGEELEKEEDGYFRKKFWSVWTSG
jgi:hypothetical protein